MISRSDGVTLVTTREQFAHRRALAEFQRQQDVDDRPHGIFIWTVAMLILTATFIAGYWIGHVRP